MSAKKTWKLGEVSVGGVITVEIIGKVITVICKDWDFSTGSRKSSDQSNAKELTRGTVLSTDGQAERKLSDFLGELTTSYYAEQIIEWIKSKVDLNNDPFHFI